MAHRWYVVHVYSGFERKIAQSLKEQAVQKGMDKLITDVLVPAEEVVEVRRGAKVNTERKFFPGYVLVKMELTDDTWHLVRSTPKVTGFVGSGTRPTPLPPADVEGILRQMEEGAEKPKLKSTFQKGDKVRVIEGPFVNFQGVIDDLNPERGKLKVMVAIFGRMTPVELEYYQVERL